ncbi:hypothetical protein LWI29_030949 [Acer saccharum]|uniref:Lon N-terminal domain-containing protein n=1 Tax=Acer saccharum TaxID=4024 RepID=A0AA39T7L4_ACESA|nr:hypothetical protein LWI29_030949 [Acer saccharum]
MHQVAYTSLISTRPDPIQIPPTPSVLLVDINGRETQKETTVGGGGLGAVASPGLSGKVLALPLSHRPLFPGFYMPLYVKDPKLLAALQENRKRQAPDCGAFLLKDEPGSDTSATETEKVSVILKENNFYNRLREVGST